MIEGDWEPQKDKEHSGAWKKKSYRLNLAAWMVAWDRYALAAQGLKQLTYKTSRSESLHVHEGGRITNCSCRMHSANVCEIAFAAPDDGYTQLVGILYDELVREYWASMSAKVRTFRVEEQASDSGRVDFLMCLCVL